jgi:S-adenosylmethionine/arginine decarboxylase-like enzyme
MLFHKHLLVNAKINKPISSEEEGIDFLKSLVEKIDMKIIKGPFSSYVDKVGNKGLTGIVMIETSHIAFHIWDEPNPGILQFDLYTCGPLVKDQVLDFIKDKFEIVSLDYRLYDREVGFVLESEGSF